MSGEITSSNQTDENPNFRMLVEYCRRLGISRERARQLGIQALNRLRHPISYRRRARR
ncbi:MAG TPA: sigma factor-like helix-turn-helix DNA-binding protein [Anaerolineaceae bacterium]|nr:sigma factor-like helix-turn-helix DNA-binding protein [Anaerolineaceae bacterium]